MGRLGYKECYFRGGRGMKVFVYDKKTSRKIAIINDVTFVETEMRDNVKFAKIYTATNDFFSFDIRYTKITIFIN